MDRRRRRRRITQVIRRCRKLMTSRTFASLQSASRDGVLKKKTIYFLSARVFFTSLLRDFLPLSLHAGPKRTLSPDRVRVMTQDMNDSVSSHVAAHTQSPRSIDVHCCFIYRHYIVVVVFGMYTQTSPRLSRTFQPLLLIPVKDAFLSPDNVSLNAKRPRREQKPFFKPWKFDRAHTTLRLSTSRNGPRHFSSSSNAV